MISAAEVTLQGISQDETLTRLRQIKQCTPEKIAKWAEMLQQLTDEGGTFTAGGASAINAEADRFDKILDPFGTTE